MHGRVGGFTNTKGWSSLLSISICGSSGLSEMTLISIATSSSSFCAMEMSDSI
ncbi:hypothetical protein Syun_029062 [Stephania yunnanensis]|uniref:Uncharacterized protein n=1 Tax=Stephania yunnanensis TaxID=152371 RepID=A0AAP0HFP6_9MAGN